MKKRVKLKISLRRFFSKNRKGIVSEYLPWLLLGIAVLAILMITIFVLKGEGVFLIDKLKSLFGG